MELCDIGNNNETILYLQNQIEEIKPLNECRLYKEEQYSYLSKNLIRVKNSIEWIMRANSTIKNIKYALILCLKHAQEVQSPRESTEVKDLYSYYLEDAVYRDLVLWDIFRQLLNEWYQCGCAITDDISIFKFLKEKKKEIGENVCRSVKRYLDSDQHQYVRAKLRNPFTHSFDATSSYILYNSNSELHTPILDYSFPFPPFQNLYYVIADVIQLLNFMRKTVNKIYQYRNSNIALLDLVVTTPCGEKIPFHGFESLSALKAQAKKMVIQCKTPCKKAQQSSDGYICRPIKISYHRINSANDEPTGTISLDSK